MKSINNNITEQLVSFEVAKLLKEKGFDVKCGGWYMEHGALFINYHKEEYNEVPFLHNTNKLLFKLNRVSAPTQQLAIDWIRMNFGICISVGCDTYSGKNDWNYGINIIGNPEFDYDSSNSYNSPEEAKEAALRYVLEKLIK